MIAPTPLEIPELRMNACSVEEHCRALIAFRDLPFWWYLGTSRIFGNHSVPFQDREGNWWYQVKPGLCWPVDFLRPLDALKADLPVRCSYLGFQHVVSVESEGNSHLVINIVQDVSTYGGATIDSKRRNAVRKGLKNCLLSVDEELNSATLEECRKAWNDLTHRTGWKENVDPNVFTRTWRRLRECPGVNIIIGREAETGNVAGFLIAKIIGDIAYVDTIASRSDLLRTNINDALMFAFVCGSARLPCVRMAHYAIKSNVENLERFKRGIGFTPISFPAVTSLRPMVGSGLRLLKPSSYRRMMGHFDDDVCVNRAATR